MNIILPYVIATLIVVSSEPQSNGYLNELADAIIIDAAIPINSSHSNIEVRDDDEPLGPIRDFDAIRHTVFRLFTLTNDRLGEIVKLGNRESLMQAGYQARMPTRFIIHDWNTDGNSEINFLIKNAYLARGPYNVFNVDWDLGSSGLYLTVRRRAEKVGRVLGEFINFLNRTSTLDIGRVYLVGFGMGAHIAGAASRSLYFGRVGVIYALDPVMLFAGTSRTSVLSSGDAQYVEVIHTSALSRSHRLPLGHANFYVNYGTLQPGCFRNIIECSHDRAYKYFAESIISNRSFYGTPCRRTLDINFRRCSAVNQPAGIMGGEFANTTNTGIYYVSTRASPPYAEGRIGVDASVGLGQDIYENWPPYILRLFGI